MPKKRKRRKNFFCEECDRFVYSYHSCGNRNCNKCQNELTNLWLEKSKARLLDVDHFIVGFNMI
ncbi:MAG: transposase zinc-binding domain-containing protein [Calditrichales bacterium]|nr:transposase zinc-binding domain-containing protein [Calditrichales bacterium]